MVLPTPKERADCLAAIREKTGFDGDIDFDVAPYLPYDLGYRVTFDGNEPVKIEMTAYSCYFPSTFWRWIDPTSEEIKKAIAERKKKV